MRFGYIGPYPTKEQWVTWVALLSKRIPLQRQLRNGCGKARSGRCRIVQDLGIFLVGRCSPVFNPSMVPFTMLNYADNLSTNRTFSIENWVTGHLYHQGFKPFPKHLKTIDSLGYKLKFINLLPGYTCSILWEKRKEPTEESTLHCLKPRN